MKMKMRIKMKQKCHMFQVVGEHGPRMRKKTNFIKLCNRKKSTNNCIFNTCTNATDQLMSTYIKIQI